MLPHPLSLHKYIQDKMWTSARWGPKNEPKMPHNILINMKKSVCEAGPSKQSPASPNQQWNFRGSLLLLKNAYEQQATSFGLPIEMTLTKDTSACSKQQTNNKSCQKTSAVSEWKVFVRKKRSCHKQAQHSGEQTQDHYQYGTSWFFCLFGFPQVSSGFWSYQKPYLYFSECRSIITLSSDPQCSRSSLHYNEMRYWLDPKDQCNDLPHCYDITTLKRKISILSKSYINLIMKTVVNFSRYTFIK